MTDAPNYAEQIQDSLFRADEAREALRMAEDYVHGIRAVLEQNPATDHR